MKFILYTVVFLLLIGCEAKKKSTIIEVDHLNIWVKNPRVAKEKLEEIGFTAIPDSLSKVHTGQGTTGRYFYFLNTYLEFIFVYDEEEFRTNAAKNSGLDFLERSKSPENGYLPFSIALKMKSYNKENIPFETIRYTQDWMGDSNRIYVAKNSKLNKEEPSLFVIYPEIEYDVFESKNDLSNIPEAYSIWRQFYQHDNGAEKISKIRIHTNNLTSESKTIRTLNALKEVELVESDTYLMELYFDQGKKNEVYDLRPEIPLKIYL